MALRQESDGCQLHIYQALVMWKLIHTKGNFRMLYNDNLIPTVFKILLKHLATQIQTYLPVELKNSCQNLSHNIQNRGVGCRCLLSAMEADVLLHVFSFQRCWEGTVKSVQREDQGNDHHNNLAIIALVPQITTEKVEIKFAGIENRANAQGISSSSSKQAIRVIGYKCNNETTVKVLNASSRNRTRTKYGFYIRQWEPFMGTTSNITIEHALTFASSFYDKAVFYSAIVSAKCT